MFNSFPLSGGFGKIDVTGTVAIEGAQNPVILRAPSAVALPAIAGEPKFGSVLSCSTGAWAADFAGSYLYQGPSSSAYQ